MSIDSTDDAPATVRYLATTPGVQLGDLADYVVRIVYREPDYARRTGTHRSYSGRFVVRARSLNAAVAEAKARFEQVAAQSAVGWEREIESIGGRPVEPGEPLEGAFGAVGPAGGREPAR